MLHRTVTRHGWRVSSDQGWLERVRRTEPPPPTRHPQSAREDPRADDQRQDALKRYRFS